MKINKDLILSCNTTEEIKECIDLLLKDNKLTTLTTTFQNIPELFGKCISFTPYLENNCKITEVLYCILHGENERICKICNKGICKFISFQKGYREICGYSCGNIKRYSKHPEQLKAVRERDTSGICKICGKPIRQLQVHISKSHDMTWGNYCKYYDILNEDKFVKCEICGEYHIGFISGHVSEKHGINSKEYLKKYPETRIISVYEEQERRTRALGKNNHMHSSNCNEQTRKECSPMTVDFWLKKGLTEKEAIDERTKFVSSIGKNFDEIETKIEFRREDYNSEDNYVRAIWSRQSTSSQNCEEQEKINEEFFEKYTFIKYGKYCKVKCEECEEKFDIINSTLIDSKNKRHNCICPICYERNSGISPGEKNVLKFIKSIYNGDVIENDCRMLCGKELDIYIPDLKFAIEFNGNYWHANPLYYSKSDEIRGKKASDIWEKDKLKNIMCKLNGINLIVIWEHDWIYFPNTCKRHIEMEMFGKSEIEMEKPEPLW